VIDIHQLGNAIWMGSLLILLGSAPGLVQSILRSLPRVLGIMPLRVARSLRRDDTYADRHNWLSLAGVALIALAMLAYLAR
jgi:hypothetical protein